MTRPAWLVFVLVLLVSLTAGFARADSSSGKKAPSKKQLFIKQFDTNRDGKLSTKERAVARVAKARQREKNALQRNAEALSN